MTFFVMLLMACTTPPKPRGQYEGLFSERAHAGYSAPYRPIDEKLWDFDAQQTTGDSGELMRWPHVDEHEGHSYPGAAAPLYVPPPNEVGPYRAYYE